MLGKGKKETKAEPSEVQNDKEAVETSMVAVPPPGALARPMEPLLGFENFDESDLSQDISGLADDNTYEFYIRLDTTGDTKTIKIRFLQVVVW